MNHPFRLSVVAAGIVVLTAACDSTGTRPTALGPSAPDTLTARFVHSGATLSGVSGFGRVGDPTSTGATFLGPVGQACAGRTLSPFDLVITSTRPVTISSFSIRLIDGSDLGPSITFPQPGFDVGALRIAAGGTRTFTFEPRFACGAALPFGLGATIAFLDGFGTLQTVRVTAAVE